MTTSKFRVSWVIDVELEDDSAVEAALEAMRLVTRPGTTANVFTVENKETHVVTTVDLMEGSTEVHPTFSVQILWGSHPDPDQEPKLYEFNTKDELDTFMDGVNEASGWLDYEIVESSATTSSGGKTDG
jgi:hypothetical protein